MVSDGDYDGKNELICFGGFSCTITAIKPLPVREGDKNARRNVQGATTGHQ